MMEDRRKITIAEIEFRQEGFLGMEGQRQINRYMGFNGQRYQDRMGQMWTEGQMDMTSSTTPRLVEICDS